MSFRDKIYVVTGAGGGIGEAYAKRLSAAGAKVVVAEIVAAQGKRVADEIIATGGSAIHVTTDVSDPASCLELAKIVRESYGGLDGVVNNAAIFAGMRFDSLMEVDQEYYERFLAVNMNGALYVIRALISLLVERGGGAIVNQSSTAAYLSGPTGAYYGISKLAMNGLTMSLAAELGPNNIRVNGIAPGPTDTDAVRQVNPETIKRIIDQMPLGRLGTTDDIADACLFLLSDQAKWITGQTLCVDGGMTRRP